MSQLLKIVRSWRKILYHEGNEFVEHQFCEENANLIDLLKKVPGCEEADENEVEERFKTITNKSCYYVLLSYTLY